MPIYYFPEIATSVNPDVQTVYDSFMRQQMRPEIVEKVKPSYLIDKLAIKCSMANWDGENAAPITPKTLEVARLFLRTLSESMCQLGVEINPEPDGSVSFEWYKNADCIVWVGIGPDEKIYHVFRIKDFRDKGSRRIIDGFPITLTSALGRYIESN